MAKRVVGVRFRNTGRIYYFDPKDLEISPDDGLIVETTYGTEYGMVAFTPKEVSEAQIVAPLRDVIRVATYDDKLTYERNLELEGDAFGICQEKISSHNLDMKLVDVEYSFNGSKITFYFTAEGRVDFRELVKDLASVFKTRIELRQIGVRDEAKMLGGLGSCGRSICCKTFLTDFQPVSIKMAKDQKLSLSPTKISGLCGRLMCCLKYEQDEYESMRKLMPRVGREVLTPDGKGSVLDNNAITEKTKVRVILPDGTADVREYHYSAVRKPSNPDDEAAVRAELEALAKAQNEAEKPEEEEFRFVTGALREEPKPQVEEKPRKAIKRKPRHRTDSQQKGKAIPPKQPLLQKDQPQKNAANRKKGRAQTRNNP